MRQYIGARYTTKIYQNSQDPNSCEWENVEFEPLTIVSFQNSSYLSRTEVPANVGNPTVATQYWAQTGFYNGQIAQLQHDVVNIYAAIDSVTRRRFIFVGDSYMSGDLSTPFTDSIKTFWNKDDDDFYVRGVGGASWTDATRSYLDLLMYLANTVENKDTITDIVVCGGTNDANLAISDIETAMSSFMSYVRSTYKNTHVWFMIDAWARNDSQTSNTGSLRYTYTKEYQGINHGITVVGVGYKALHNYADDFISDGIHPSNNGQIKLARVIANALTGGDLIVNRQYAENPISMTTSDAISSPAAIDVQVNVLEDGIHLNINDVQITFDTEVNTYTNILLGTGDFDMLSALDPGISGIMIPCVVASAAAAKQETLPVRFWIKDNNMYCYICGNSFATVKTIYFRNSANLHFSRELN